MVFSTQVYLKVIKW